MYDLNWPSTITFFPIVSSSVGTNLSEIITESNCQEVQNIFTKLGIIPKIKSGYYYPSSNQATSIRNALLTECLEKGVVIKTNTYVTNIEKKDNLFIPMISQLEFILINPCPM